MEGTIASNQYPCPPGTYASGEETVSEEDCVDAPAGDYVSGSGNTAVTGRYGEKMYPTALVDNAYDHMRITIKWKQTRTRVHALMLREVAPEVG